MGARNSINTSLPVLLKLMVVSLKVLQNFEKSYFQHLIIKSICFSQWRAKAKDN